VVANSVDNRIVSIRFDNANFEKNVAATISSLDKLNAKLEFKGASKGLEDVGTAASKVDLSGMAAGVQKIASRFSALGAIGFTVIQNLTTSAMKFVENWARKDIFEPIITGGKTRANNIEQAKFQFRGLGVDVDQAMASALGAVKGTAYGLDEAAKAAAQFAASGIGAGKDMTQSLRGIAGTAAMTGSSFSDMAYLFTTSAASGRITNIDLQQFATRGLNAAAALGKQMGKTESEIHQMATAGTLDYKTFAAAMDQAFGAHATQANETYTGSLANLHAAMSRLGAAWFGPEREQQRDLFNALTPAIDSVTAALQPLIDAFLKMKGIATGNLINMIKGIDFTNLTKSMPNFAAGFMNIFKLIQQIAGIAKDAFTNIFPPKATSTLLSISEAFKKFSEHLKMGADTANKLKSIFSGFFSVLSIGWEIIKGLALVFGDLLAALFPASKGFLSFGAGVGDALTKLKTFLVDGGRLHAFFAGLGDAIASAINWIKKIGKAIGSFFSMSFGKDNVSDRFKSIESGAKRVQGVFKGMGSAFDWIMNALDKVGNYISTFFSNLGQNIAKAMNSTDFNSAIDVLNVGLLGGIVVMLQKFFKHGLKLDLTGGLMGKVNGIFTELTKTLQSFQMKIKSEALMKIAQAIALLTAAVVVLSLIDSVALTKALTAMAVGFGELAGTLEILNRITSTSGGAKLLLVSGALIGIAAAIDILSIAIAVLSRLSPKQLAQGLIGIAVALGILVIATEIISANPVKLIAAGAGLLAMSVGLLILSHAVKTFADMSWGDMAKGLVGVGIGVALVAAALTVMPASSVISGLGFIEIAVGLTILQKAVSAFAGMSWGEMAKGMVGIAGGLIIIAVAMQAMPLSLPITAAGILVLSVALGVMAGAVKMMGSLSLATLAKGLISFAAMLLILVVAVNAMQGAILGAAAMIVVAKAMDILAKVLVTLGKLSIAQIVTALLALVGVLAVLAVASIALAEITPAMLALGAALIVIGAGFMLFGAGAFLAATAFQVMAASGVVGALAIVKALDIIGQALPKLAADLALFAVNFVKNFLAGLPDLIKMLGKVLDTLADELIKFIPKLGKLIRVLLDEVFKIIREDFPKIIETANEMILAFLQGISDHVGEFVTVGVEIITNFINGIADNIPLIGEAAVNLITSFLETLIGSYSQIIDAGFQLLIQFLFGITSNIIEVVNAVTTIIVTFVQAIQNNLLYIIAAGVQLIVSLVNGIAASLDQIVTAVASLIVTFLNSLSKHLGEIITAGANLIIAVITGIGQKSEDIVSAGVAVIISFIEGLGKNALKLAEAAAKVLEQFLEGLTTAIRTHAPKIREDAKELGLAIADGVTLGMASKVEKVAEGAANLASKALAHAKSAVGADSPSKAFMELGGWMAEGMAIALNNDTSVASSAEGLATSAVTAIQDSLNKVPSMLADLESLNPVITPVVDLTNVQKAAKDISGYVGSGSVVPNASFQQANAISAATLAAQVAATSTPPAPAQVNFEQTINAPTALTTNDIYRNTKSQIKLAKEELKIS
jgi:tape measure domain-containing protein